MDIRFKCPGCGKKLNVGEEHTGKRAECPGCGKALIIPHPVVQPQGSDQPSTPTPSPDLVRDQGVRYPSTAIKGPARRRFGPWVVGGSVRNVIIAAVCLALVALLVVIIGSGPDGPPAPMAAYLATMSSSLETYKATYSCYPPDCGLDVHPDLDMPAECLVYYLSGASICYTPGVTPPDYPWRHPIYHHVPPDGRRTLARYYPFDENMLRDADADGIPEFVDFWGQPIFYNCGSDIDGRSNQNGRPRQNPDKFDLVSSGPDKMIGTDDDIDGPPR